MNMNRIRYSLVCIMLLAFLAGCGKKEDNKPTQTETPIPTVIPTKTTAPSVAQTPKESAPAGMARSKLTNEWIPEEKTTTRPYAIMFNNIQAAFPQSGTSQAGILYECLVEGGITRLMGVFDNFDSDRIGSVRSARHYYVSIADEYDAIYVHYGQSKYTQAVLDKLDVDNLSGLTSIGSTVFYRDKNIKAPHNAFASYEGIIKGTKKLKYRTEYRENMTSHYKFFKEDTELSNGSAANKVTIPFSKKFSPVFEYDATEKVYKRFQFDKSHIDANTKKQLAFKNLIIQFVEESTMDEKGRQDMNLSNAKGEGYYFTDGKYIKITWVKNESKESMTYYDESGNELTVNTGKTYIGLFPAKNKDNIKIK